MTNVVYAHGINNRGAVHTANPRYLRGPGIVAERYDLIEEDDDQRWKVTSAGKDLLASEFGATERGIDLQEGMAELLRFIQVKPNARRGGEELVSVHFSLRGRPLGRGINSMCKRSAIRSVHSEVPNGRPFRNEARTVVNSASLCMEQTLARHRLRRSASVRPSSSHSGNGLRRGSSRPRPWCE
jgi:hypothetical protein